MPAFTISRASPHGTLASLIVINGLTVSTLYWAQSVVTQAAAEFGPSTAVRLMPGASLAGYALGVALLASLAPDLTSASGLVRQILLLAAGLCVAAAAPSAPVALLGCVIIGLGCSLTQRLLVSATSAVPATDRARTIGWIIASGLVGILLARALVPVASAAVGWRALFFLDAAVVLPCGLAAAGASQRALGRLRSEDRQVLPAASTIWRAEAVLRRAALQLALVFAAFNLGWAVFPRLLAADGASPAPALSMGAVAALGAVAAIVAGRACGRWDPANVARVGLYTVTLAVLAAALTIRIPAACHADMALLEMGTQIALVANQARAQALATSPAMRGRLAAMVTTIGFAGGAIGAAVGNFLI